jgi:integrase
MTTTDELRAELRAEYDAALAAYNVFPNVLSYVFNGKTVIPVTAELLAAVQAMPLNHLTYVHSRNGKPLSKKSLGVYFRQWATEAGLPARCRLHGLKKSGMVDWAAAGATVPELMAGSGHKDIRIVQHYIDKAFARPELAQAAFTKLRTKRAAK